MNLYLCKNPREFASQPEAIGVIYDTCGVICTLNVIPVIRDSLTNYLRKLL